MIKIIGLQRKKGVFTGDNGECPYDNTIIYYVTGCSDISFMGCKGCSIKIKTKKLTEMLGLNLTEYDQLQFLIEKDVSFETDYSTDTPTISNIVIL